MKTRILLGAAMIAAVAGLLVLDWWLEQVLARRASPACTGGLPAGRPVLALPLAVVFLVLTLLAFVELARLAAFSGVTVLVFSGIVGAAALGTLPFWWQFLDPYRPPGGMDVLVVLAAAVLAAFAEQMIRWRMEDAFRRIACTLLAVLYLGVGGAIILAIRLTYGVPALALFLAAVKSADIGAYFTGSAIGRHKLIPWLSPGKSWEGLAGGVAAAAGVSILAVWALGLRGVAAWQAAVFGAATALAGQFGDLCESLLKRSASLKDSGYLLPEFGGLLDILDSPLLAAPAAYLVLAVCTGA